MSTYMYLTCLDHDPILRSEDVGQHLYDLPRIRDDIAHTALFVANAQRPWPVDYGHHFVTNAARFLVEHQRCRIGIEDEYGNSHPPTEEADR